MPDTVIAYITHDDWPNISPASSPHGAKRLGGLCAFTDAACTLYAASVYVTLGCPSVRPSVCLSRRSTAAATCSWFAADRLSIESCRRQRSGCGRRQCCDPRRRINAELFCVWRGGGPVVVGNVGDNSVRVPTELSMGWVDPRVGLGWVGSWVGKISKNSSLCWGLRVGLL